MTIMTLGPNHPLSQGPNGYRYSGGSSETIFQFFPFVCIFQLKNESGGGLTNNHEFGYVISFVVDDSTLLILFCFWVFFPSDSSIVFQTLKN